MKYLIVYLVIITTNTHAFTWEKCRKTFYAGGAGVGIFLSTTSYISSTGDCSMIGKVGHDKKVFLVQNFFDLKQDIARGSGDHINAYTLLMRCSEKSQRSLPTLLKDNYKKIYNKDSLNSPKRVHENIEKVMRNSSLRADCSLAGA